MYNQHRMKSQTIKLSTKLNSSLSGNMSASATCTRHW